MKPLNSEEIESKLLNAPNSKHNIDLLAEFACDIQHQEPEKGLEVAERAHSMSEELGYTNGIAVSLKAQAQCLLSLKDYHEAIEKASQAKAIFDNFNNLNGKATSQSLIADGKFALKDYTDSLTAYLDCLKIYEILDDYDMQTQVLSKIGNIYANVGDYRTAISYQIKAISGNPNKISIEVGKVLKKLAELYHQSGKLLASLDYLNKAAIIFKKHNQESSCVDCYERMGLILIQQKEFRKAEQWLMKTHEFRQNTRDDEGLTKSFMNYARYYKDQEDFDQAISMYIQALEKASQIQKQGLIADIRYALGQIYHLIHKDQQAIEEYNQALLICSQVDKMNLCSDIHYSLSMLNETQDNLKEALFHFKQHYDINHKIWRDQKELESKNILFKQEVEESKKEAEIYRLKNVELADANNELKMITLSLEEANREKELLLDRLREQTESLEELVIFDGLTGLANRRHFDEQFKYEFLRAKRYGRTLSVALADIDFFKKVNDTFSHQVGDDVLKTIARIFKSNCRAGDLVARYGGEEFVFLFTETSLENAVLACEKIRHSVQIYDWDTIHEELKITVSMGVANSDNFENQEDLVILSDQKLYEAKNNGRNQVKK